MNRGILCWVDLEPSSSSEFGKTRPAIVVSNSEQNRILPTVVVVPLSSKAPEIWPLRLEIPMPLEKPSFAVIPGVRQISKTRIKEVVGQIPAATLERLTQALALYLAD